MTKLSQKTQYAVLKRGNKTKLVNQLGKAPNGPLKIMFDSEQDLQNWYNILYIATRSDTELLNDAHNQNIFELIGQPIDDTA